MVKKDAKAKAAEKKLRVAAKQTKKATQKDKKSQNKPKSSRDADSSDDDTTDLDALLASYAAQQEQYLKVTETISDAPPQARSSSTLIASPSNTNELLLFGGESYENSLARFYNDLHIYNISRDEWRLVTSPNTPLPRSGHAWTRGGNAGGIYLFGGEFSSPKQGVFYHYGDFWRLDPSKREWTKIEAERGKGVKTPGAPSARSGHRMTFFKQYVVLFGGFQDTSSSTKYLNDLWLYNTNDFKWYSPALPPASQRPDARSSFSFLPHEKGAVLYGGYSRVKAATSTRPTKGGGTATHTVLKPMVHQDTWFLRIEVPSADAASGTPPIVRWEKRKRPANAPNPARASAMMAHHRGRGIQFGGVHDVEDSEEGIDSEFFNTLFVWNVERNRYFSLALRRPKAGQKKPAAATEKARRGRGKADEEELLRNLAALETKGTVEAEVEGLQRLPEDEEDAPEKPEKAVIWEMPHPRFNAQLAVQDDILYIYGGTFERGDREFTFDELWAIDLGKLDGVKEIFRRELEHWTDTTEADSDEEGDEDDEDSRSDASSSDETESHATEATEATTAITTPALSAYDDDTTLPSSSLNDTLPHPRPFETLRAFYARTSTTWQEYLLEDAGVSQVHSIKEVRKSAFERAEEKWWDCREEIRALEDEQEASGIGEVVSLEKGAGAGAGGKRR
ncbi:MAG: hypothetical protein M1828_005175 [Chrysothrix sp. TS-e1954]|nr:MAG: hypothetical protein M1828_005175 [Chrysothrix sp. TS-e1954]